MSDAHDDKRGSRAWELAGRQHGVITRRQLLALGFDTRSIEHRLARGRLHPVMRGVYAVGWPQLTRERRWMAATLACGGGIPVTGPAQTLVDLATELPPLQMERTVNEADKRGLVDPETLRSELGGRAGQPGVRPLRNLLDKRTFRLSDSDLEVLFRPIAASASLPLPLTKQRVNGFEVDFFWPDLGLVVETDGLRYHRTPSTQARDARRDRSHVLAGMTPLRFTHYEVKFERARVRRALEGAAALLGKPREL